MCVYLQAALKGHGIHTLVLILVTSDFTYFISLKILDSITSLQIMSSFLEILIFIKYPISLYTIKIKNNGIIKLFIQVKHHCLDYINV